MLKFAKPLSMALIAATMSVATVDMANAGYRGRVGTGVAVGLGLGLLAGAAVAGERRYEPGYYGYADCSELRRRAMYFEDTGRPGRADYWWGRWHECTGR